MEQKKITKQVGSSLQENTAYMNEILPIKNSFDLVQRDIVIGGRKVVFIL